MLDIIIPCHAEPFYLKRLLNSIIDNIKSKNYSIYIIDDCSQYSNEYITLIKKLNSLINIQYFKTEKNSGPAVARNIGLKNSKSKYICFLDDDDEIVYNILNIISNKEDYDIISTPLDLGQGQIIRPNIFMGSVCPLILKREFLIKNNLYFNEKLSKNGAEDLLFRTSCFLISNKIKYEEIIFYKRNYRQDSHFVKKKIIPKYSSNDETLESLRLLEQTIQISLITNLLTTIQYNDQQLYLLFKELFINLKNQNTKKGNNKFLQDLYLIYIFLINKYFKTDMIQQKDDIYLLSLIIFSKKYCKIENNILYFNFNHFYNYNSKIQTYLPNFLEIFKTSFIIITDISNLLNIYSEKYYEVLKSL